MSDKVTEMLPDNLGPRRQPAPPCVERSLSVLPPPNPFATHRVRAGRLPFLFSEGGDGQRLAENLASQAWRGQIVGPHGSGKTTLLRSLAPLWTQHDRQLATFELRNRQRTLPFSRQVPWNERTLVVVDGYEQLAWTARWRLYWRIRSCRAGLLVTSHRPVAGLPLLYRTTTSLELAQQLVHQLDDSAMTHALIAQCYATANGNLRETFMLLFDEFATRSSGHVCGPPRCQG